ncbi:MAG TPA: general stress protein [Mycobacteriales bacterium]
MTTSPSGSVTSDLVPVASYATYTEAQRAVDRLSDQGFPVEGTLIVGVGLKLVEHVVGRQTWLRATGRGALAGAWFGLLFGLFLGLFMPGPVAVLATVLWALLWGVVAGAIFGVVTYAMTGGERDFVSVGALAADRYEVLVPSANADRARTVIAPPAS